MKKLSVRTRFKLGTGLILFVFCVCGSVLVYRYGKNNLKEAAYKETELYIATAEATRTYVKEVLRPKMWEILPEDHFIVEAMSTSFVGRDIMTRLHGRFKNFRYKRASMRPMNPANQADVLELEMIAKFNADPSVSEWNGIIEREGHAYYSRFRGIFVEAECMRCHGQAQDAPPAIIDRYGADAKGYGYQLGEAVAADTIYIPVDFYFAKLKRQAWMTFFVGGGLLLLLLMLFYALFNHTVIAELKGLVDVFKRIGGHQSSDAVVLEPKMMDEIGQLKLAFENTASDLDRVHSELRESEIKYRRLFETSRDPIFIWSANKKVLDINAAGLELFRFENIQEARSVETIHQLFWDARDGVRLIELLTDAGFVKDYEISLVNRDGDHLYGLITANLSTEDDGRSTGFEGTIRDITQRKHLEKQLARTEKLAAVGQLAAGLAHEINNPLGVIHCYANLIEKSATEVPTIKDDVLIIQKHTLGCKKIVEALLNFARVSETKKRRGDIRQAVDTVLILLEKQMINKSIRIQHRHDEPLPKVVFDLDKMNQVFINLLINAIHAVGSDGVIKVTTSLSPDQETVQIQVEDNGNGIPTEILDFIFDPFFTTKKTGEGTGLGLSISYGIVKEHGGDIHVESAPGKGAVFTVTLPADHSHRI